MPRHSSCSLASAAQRIHASLGLREVGSQAVAGGEKRVSMQIAGLRQVTRTE
jgi:predicted GNAT superfamily acetyltransferase